MSLRYLKSFDSFLNESKIYEAVATANVSLVNPKLSKAADLIAAVVNRKAGGMYKKFPFLVTKTIDGMDSDGVMFYSSKDDSAFRVAAAANGAGAIVGSLEYYADHASDVATMVLSSDKFPITKLVGEFILLITDKNYADSVQEGFSFEDLFEGKDNLSPAEINQINKLLDQGESVREISKLVGVPRKLVYQIKSGVSAVEKTSNVESKNEETLEDKVQYLEELMEDIYEISRKVAAGYFNSLFISGRAGTGKTYHVERALHDEGLEDETDYIKISGAVSPVMMYKQMYNYKNKMLIFDDCDSVFKDEQGRNMLKAALDTKKIRKISWFKKSSFVYDPKDFENNPEGELNALENGMVPAFFEFSGKIIFISNMEKEKADPDGAIRSRSILIDVNPDDATLMERLKLLLPHLEPKELPLKDKEEIFEFMKSANDISMRTFVKAAGFKIAQLPNWKRMAQRYL